MANGRPCALFILQVLAAELFGVGLMKHVPPTFPGTVALPGMPGWRFPGSGLW